MRHVRTVHPVPRSRICKLQKTFDGEMKRIQAKGVGTHAKQTEEEEQMLSKGVFGKHTPQALLNTIFFMCGIFFAL